MKGAYILLCFILILGPTYLTNHIIFVISFLSEGEQLKQNR